MDFGSALTKAGYAGEDTPRAVFPSWIGIPPDSASNDQDQSNITSKQPMPGEDAMDVDVGSTTTPVKKRKKRFIGENRAYLWQPHVEMKNPFVDGLCKCGNELAALGFRPEAPRVDRGTCIVQDWELLESLWDHAMYHSLRVDTTEHPLLLSEAPFNTQKARERFTEIAFEKYNVPAFYLEKSPILSAFAYGKHTALVVESGAGSTCVTPVSEGHMLRKGNDGNGSPRHLLVQDELTNRHL